MATLTSEQIRNVVLMAHGGAGKTSLVESLAHRTGVTARLGRVDDGNTLTDFDPEERKRKMSLSLSVASLEYAGHRLNLIDTPGYAEFLGEVMAGARAADAALIVVDATAGVQVGTETAWRLARERRLPVVVVVNRLDKENARWDATVAALRATLGPQCAALQVPIGTEAAFRGVVDVVEGKASLGADGTAAPPPADLAGAIAAAREALVERIAEADEDLLRKYLEGETLTEAEIRSGLKAAILARTLVPVVATAATAEIGTAALLRLMVEELPSPVDAGAVPATLHGKTVDLPVDPSAPPVALVFKTTADEFVGKLTYFRVFSGAISGDQHLWNTTRGEDERLGHVSHIVGKDLKQAAAIIAGDIGAVTKLNGTATFDTLATKDHPVLAPPPAVPPPTFSAALEPHAKGDVEKLGPSLHRLVEEDPTLHVERDPDTGEMIISGLGESHVELAAERLHRKFKVNVDIKGRRIPYRETITAAAQAEFLHKKQSGGHGQYARVALRVEPRARGEGFVFANEVVGGAVPRNFIPAVEKGVEEALPGGVLAHYPMVDLRVVLYDGKHHDVDSSEMAFKLAASQALKEAVARARPILLEPILHLTVTAPETATGDVMSDLNTRRARVLGMEPGADGATIVQAEGPMAEFQRYAMDLRSMTGGRGTFISTFARYDPVPDHVAKKVIEGAQAVAAAS